MTYTLAEVVKIEVKEISPETKGLLMEYLRVNVVHPATRGNGSGEDSFVGIYAKPHAELIKRWLEEHGAVVGHGIEETEPSHC